MFQPREKIKTDNWGFYSLVGNGFGRLFSVFRFIDCFTRFRWHVVLIVLREHLICMEHAVGTDLSLRHATASFFKQIGENAFVYYRNAGGRVSYGEVYGQAIGLALQGAILNEATNPESPIKWGLFRSNLRGAEKENQVFAKCAQRQKGRERQTSESD